MSNFKDLKGQKFGRLLVINRHGSDTFKAALWLCKCECGNECIVASSNLRRHHTQSCGCLQKEATAKANTTHGYRHTSLYNIWNSMIGRCQRKNSAAYSMYGGRGISVCEEWKSFKGFLDWSMNNGYKNGLSIDRIDNDKGYSPDNCRWVTMDIQANNKRSNRIIDYKGQCHTVAEWSKILGIRYMTLRKRVEKGWSTEAAFFTPIRGGG